MAKAIKKLHGRERGFTLIELLVVVLILGLLAGVAMPAVFQFVGKGKCESARTELEVVQTAMDSMMVHNALTTVTLTAATNDMSAFPTGNALYSAIAADSFMRKATTQYTYSCDASGKVTGGADWVTATTDCP